MCKNNVVISLKVVIGLMDVGQFIRCDLIILFIEKIQIYDKWYFGLFFYEILMVFFFLKEERVSFYIF